MLKKKTLIISLRFFGDFSIFLFDFSNRISSALKVIAYFVISTHITLLAVAHIQCIGFTIGLI